ncbi:hypothetical protein MASR1M74_09790 [Lentimicrobium sp.]
MFLLINAIFTALAAILDEMVFASTDFQDYKPALILYLLFIITPMLAITVRRLHDTGRSGKLIFWGLIPVIGIVWLLFVLSQKGEQDDNKFGKFLKEYNQKLVDEQLIFIYIIFAFISRSFNSIIIKLNHSSLVYRLLALVNEHFNWIYGIIPLALAFVIKKKELRFIALFLGGILLLLKIYVVLKRPQHFHF